jgi:hypothetical protein
MAAMSSFFMPSIAFIARCAPCASGPVRHAVTGVGTTYHDTPKQSFTHPHGPC